jgi:uncharacterized membrane protein YGL010W
MSAAMQATERPIDRWFAHYSADHRHPVNQLIHVFCVPAIFWSAIALAWCVPPAGVLFAHGVLAAVLLFGVWLFYFRLSPALAVGALAFFLIGCFLCRLIEHRFGIPVLFRGALILFVVAWIGQFIGHSKLYEGKKPSFFTDLSYLLIGPIWVLSKLYKKLGWKY